jgi:hypothetical protein
MDTLEEKIQTLQYKIRKNIKCLNAGGCGYFAYYFSERLKELNISHSIYFEDYFPIGTTLKEFYTPSHVVIFIKGIGFIDGYKTLDRKRTSRSYSRIRYQIKKTLTRGDWNNMYDRRQNRSLKKLIYENIK